MSESVCMCDRGVEEEKKERMFLSNAAKSQSGRDGFFYTSTLQLNFRQKLSNSQWLKVNTAKLVHGCVQYMLTVNVHTAKYSHYKALRKGAVCVSGLMTQTGG